MRQSILQAYARAFRDIPKYYLSLIIPLVADMLFFVLYFMLVRFHEIRFQNVLFEMESSLAMKVNGLVENFAGTVSIFELFDMFPIIKTTVYKLILYNALLTLAIALIYIIFQAISWKACYDIAGKKVRYLPFLKRFALNAAFWTAVIMLFNVLYFMLRFVTIMIFDSTGLLIMLAWWLIVLAIVYYGLVCHGGLDRKFSIGKCIRKGNKQFRKLLPAFILMIVTIYLVNLIVSLIPLPNVRMVFEIIAVIPTISVMRVFFLRTA